MKRILTLSLFLILLPVANAQLTVSNFAVNFYDQDIGGFGATSSVSIQNNGPQAVQLNVTSTCFSDFTIDNYCSLTLGPNFSCSLDIHFQPRQVGYMSCSISISDTAGDYATINVSGRGTRKD